MKTKITYTFKDPYAYKRKVIWDIEYYPDCEEYYIRKSAYDLYWRWQIGEFEKTTFEYICHLFGIRYVAKAMNISVSEVQKRLKNG